MSIRLRTFLILTIMALVILLSAALSIIGSNNSTSALEDEIGNSLAGTANQMSDKLDNFMWSRAGEVDIVGSLDVFQDSSIPGIQKLLNQLKTSFPSFSWVGYLDPQGKVVASTDNILLGNDLSARPVYLQGLKGRFFGDVHDAVLLAKLLPNPSGEPLQFVDISIPVKNPNGQLLGILAAHMSWEWAKEVEKTILPPIKSSNKDIELFIVSKTDNTVILGPEEMVGTTLSIPSIRLAQKGNNGWEVATWPDGKSYLTGYAYGDGYLDYPGLGWTVLVREPQSIAFAKADDMQRLIMLTGVVAALVFGLIGWRLAEWIAKPIRRISAAADQLRNGENVSIPKHTFFTDIAILSRSLQNLVDSLGRTETALGSMQKLALHDQLTAMPNRNALEHYLERSIHKVDRTHHTLSFLYLDLDGFKKVNDSLGHQIGDILLQKVAQRLQENVRGEDIAVRLGGDEFLIVLQTSGHDPLPEAKQVADAIIGQLNRTFVIDYHKINIGCSIGCGIYPLHGPSPYEVIRLADEALYVSKRAGKNCVSFHQAAGTAQEE